MPYIGTQPKDVRSFGKVQFDFTATQGQTAFTGADDDGKTLGFTEGQIQVYVNGILMDASDYTTSNTNTVTLVSAANLNDIITVVALQTDIPNSDYVPISGGTFTGDMNFSSDLTVGATAIHVDQTNNRLGVGTSSPDVPLQVHSDALGTASGDDQQLFRLHSPDTSNNTTYRFLNYRYTAGSSHSSSELRIQRHVDVTEQGYMGFRDGATTFGYGSTERMRIDNAGRVTISNQPAFLCRPAAGYSLSAGDTTVEGTWTTDYNIGSHFNTSNGRFTAPVAGVYAFSWAIFASGSLGTRSDAWISVNGGIKLRTEINSYNSGSTNRNQHVHGQLKLSANDIVRFGTYQTNSSTIYSTTTPWSYAAGYLLG